MIFQGLFNLRAHVSHFELGGVTAGQWVVGISHGMQDVISHFTEKGLPGASKKALRHVLHFEKLGCAIGAPPCFDTASYRGWHKFMGAVYPDGLLSNLKLNKEVIAPGPLAPGWVIQRLSVQELANTYDLPLTLRVQDMEVARLVNILTGSVP
eukprot:7046488-Ditylum_brightwellii.AAC.1